MKLYLERHLSVFRKEMFFSSLEMKNNLYTATRVLGGVFIFICLTKSNFGFLPINYFNEGIKETVGPHAWNIIGAFGLMALGIFFIFPKIIALSKVAKFLLFVAYSIGLWSWSIMFIEIFFSIPTYFTTLPTWKAFLATILILILITLVFLINYTTLFIGQVLERLENNKFFYKLISNLHFPIRLIIFIILTIFPLIFLLLEQ
ncbi:TPA: hypothetical protein U2Q76_001797 [Acinetobacter baumannii]|nr:hypothetical protein [Acinetobacter baumannii]HEM8710837.1 hypothetical protein [Acinetobacter baumannii]